MTIYLAKDQDHDYIDDHDEKELSNFGGTFKDQPEIEKLNKRGSKESWFKSKPENLQIVSDSFEQID